MLKTEKQKKLPRGFRKFSAEKKRLLLSKLFNISTEELAAVSPSCSLVELADVMVESSVGVMPLPLGIAAGFQIDGEIFNIPMVTEEPSVLAAANYVGGLVSRMGSGFTTKASTQIMTAQIAIENAKPDAKDRVQSAEKTLRTSIRPILAKMEQRGGGYRGIEAEWLLQNSLLVVKLHVDTQDAMGANIINTAAEALREPLEAETGGTVLMAILTNALPHRHAEASFQIPVRHLPGKGKTAKRIVRANEFANACPDRAVTHNKGIMNGISALALATGNDTRAMEAAVHAYASRNGTYRALTEYTITNNCLTGSLKLPIAMGTVGGSVGFHPVSTLSLRILFMHSDKPKSAARLSSIAVSLGLAQNLAALIALVGEGIQSGHMLRHARRLAWKVGARKEQIQELAENVWRGGVYNVEAAAKLLQQLQAESVQS